MIDILYFIILVLNATGLFVFLAPQFGVSIGVVSGGLLGVNLLYILIKARYSIAIIKTKGIGSWLSVLLIWPLLTVMYSPSLEIRAIALQLYYFSLFYATMVYGTINGLSAMHRVMTVSLVLTLLGLVLSMIVPNYFEGVSNLAGANIMRESRACGFLLQPNQLAISLGFLFIGWFMFWKRKNAVLKESLVLLAFLTAILLTGSRTGMLIAMIIVAFILMPRWKRNELVVRRKYLRKLGMLLFCLTAGIIGMKYYLAQLDYAEERQNQDLIDRMENLLSFKLTSEGGINEIGSLQERAAAQVVYKSLFNKKPLLGHGLGADIYYKEHGPIFLSAHSDALTTAMKYGVFYPMAILSLMFILYRESKLRGVELILKTNSFGQFCFVTSILVVISSILDTRTFYIVLGLFVTIAYSSQEALHYQNRIKVTSSPLPRRKVFRFSSGGR